MVFLAELGLHRRGGPGTLLMGRDFPRGIGLFKPRLGKIMACLASLFSHFESF